MSSPSPSQGKKFLGDLLTDGKIVWQETGQVFNSPSAWATYCKKLVNPAKKSGCGWASVKYKGQKLDQYKAVWLKKYQPNAPPAEEVNPFPFLVYSALVIETPRRVYAIDFNLTLLLFPRGSCLFYCIF